MTSMLSVFTTATDGACGISGQQRVVLWNPAAESILGFEAGDVLGRHCFEVFHGSDEDSRPVCQRDCPIFRLARNTKSAPTALLRTTRRDGAEIWLSVSTVVIPSCWNVEAVLVHLFRDVSHLKDCETAIERLVASLHPSAAATGGIPGHERPAPSSTPCLTNRENEVLQLLAAGQSTREIARTLFVSPSTVRNHVHNILAKLDVHSRLEAVTTALRFGLLSRDA